MYLYIIYNHTVSLFLTCFIMMIVSLPIRLFINNFYFDMYLIILVIMTLSFLILLETINYFYNIN